MSLILNGTDGLSDVDGTAGTPAIRGTDANTGIFFSAADTIDFAEGGVATGQFDSSGNFKFNSGYGSVATAFGCRAWVNFDGTANSNLTGTYSQSGFTMTVTVTSHGLSSGQSVFITFQTGAATAESFTVVSVTNANVFVVTSVTSRTTSGNCTLNFNTIRGSGNVSSITRASAGQYTVNLTTTMPDINYCAIASASTSSAPGGTLIEMFTATNSTQVATAPTTSSFQMAFLLYNASAFHDPVYVNVAVFR